jgi:hypothetical protein
MCAQVQGTDVLERGSWNCGSACHQSLRGMASPATKTFLFGQIRGYFK